MSLTNLPNELLLQIVAEVWLLDILNFSQTCRMFRSISYHRVQQYMKMAVRSIDVTTALAMFLQICDNPAIALFPKRLECHRRCLKTINPSKYYATYRPIEYGESIKAPLLESIGSFNDSRTDDWVEELTRYRRMPCKPVTPLILASLRDLRTLVVGCFCAIDLPLLNELVDRAVGDTDAGVEERPLSKLATIKIAPTLLCPNMGMEYLLHFFMPLPSLRHIEAIDIDWKVPPILRVNPGSSRVTTVSLVDSMVAAQVISTFLTTINSLKCFTYEAKFWDDEQPGGIIETLHTHASETLENLTLYARKGREWSLLSLRLPNKFQKLKSLGLAARRVIDPNVQRYSWSLPTTVKTLCLYADSDDNERWLYFVKEIDRLQQADSRFASRSDALSIMPLKTFSGQHNR